MVIEYITCDVYDVISHVSFFEVLALKFTGVFDKQGQIQDFGRGGLITMFTSGSGYGRGRAPPVTARGSGGRC